MDGFFNNQLSITDPEISNAIVKFLLPEGFKSKPRLYFFGFSAQASVQIFNFLIVYSGSKVNSSFVKWLFCVVEVFLLHYLYLQKKQRYCKTKDLYHILMSSTFFVAADRFLDYVFRCLC